MAFIADFIGISCYGLENLAFPGYFYWDDNFLTIRIDAKLVKIDQTRKTA